MYVFGLPSVHVIVENTRKKFVDSLISRGQYKGLFNVKVVLVCRAAVLCHCIGLFYDVCPFFV